MDHSSRDERARLPAVPATPAASTGSVPASSPPRSRAWVCAGCGALLGRLSGGELHVKYKDAEHWISGRCRHACRRCGRANTICIAETGDVR